MGFFRKNKTPISVVLIDIDASSVGAALVHTSPSSEPTIYYTTRHTINAAEHEDASAAMLRTLTTVSGELTTKGAPTLRNETGSGHIDRVLVSIGAPWQKTAVRTELVSAQKPFVFTQALLSEITQKDKELPGGFKKSHESVVATFLNGYEIEKPFGKKASRAELIIVSSLVHADMAKAIESSLRKTYHTHALTLTAFASAAYAVFRDLYPHEKDFLLVQVSDTATDVLSIKNNVLSHVVSTPHGLNEVVQKSIEDGKVSEGAHALIDPIRNARFDTSMAEAEQAWLSHIQLLLQELATSTTLPRTVFLIATQGAQEYLKRLLDTPAMRALWLTSDAVRILPIVPAQLTRFVKTRGEAGNDLSLELLALFASKTL